MVARVMDALRDDNTRTLLRPDEAARRLGLTARMLELWRRRGHGPHWVRLTSRVIRYPADALETWIHESQGAPLGKRQAPP